MITKETFIKIVGSIQEQNKIDEKVSKALELLSDSYVMMNTKNLMYDSLYLLLKEIFNDKGDWISWWIYENVEKKVFYQDKLTSDSITKDLTDVNDLYDFLISNKNENEDSGDSEIYESKDSKNCLNCKWYIKYKLKDKCKLTGKDTTDKMCCNKFL